MMNDHSRPWSIGARIVFRFFFVYFVLYAFPYPIHLLPLPFIYEGYIGFWNFIIPWVGSNMLHLAYEITTLPNGSGDTTWNYVHVLIIAFLAVGGALIWTIADRKHPDHEKLFYWLVVGLRYYVGMTLIHYGFAKIFKTQFPLPSLELLSRSYAESSPMRLLWTFMGYSTAYNFFTGLFEALGGLLLLFRRTKILGGLISLTVLLNIVMLNFTYDVPVKLLSLHLTFMTIFILVPDIKRLLNFFVLNKSVSAVSFDPIFQSKHLQTTHRIAKSIFIFVLLGNNIFFGFRRMDYVTNIGKPIQFQGTYEVQHYIVNQDTLPPLLNDTRRWKSISVNWSAFTGKELASIKYMDDASIGWTIEADTLNRMIKLYSMGSDQPNELRYRRDGNDYFLWGVMNTDSIKVSMRKVDSQSRLLTRGFHWINETPYN